MASVVSTTENSDLVKVMQERLKFVKENFCFESVTIIVHDDSDVVLDSQKKDPKDSGAIKMNAWTFVDPSQPIYPLITEESTDNTINPLNTAASLALETVGSSDVTPLSSSTKVVNITDWFSLGNSLASDTVASSDHPIPVSSSSTVTNITDPLSPATSPASVTVGSSDVTLLNITDLSSVATSLALETVEPCELTSLSSSTKVMIMTDSLSPTSSPPSGTVASPKPIPPLPSTEAMNLTDPSTPGTSLALETVASSDLTPFSSMSTASKEQKEAIASTNQSRTMKSETVKCDAVAEIVMKHLSSAQLQMLDGRDIYLQPKRVLDAVINFAKSFIQLLEEKDSFNEPKARKATLAVLSFMLPFLVCRLFLSYSGSQSSFNGAILPPT